MGNTSDQSVCDFANRKLPVFATPFLDLGATYVDAMPVLWDGNGVHPPTIQNATGCTQQDSRFWWFVSDFGSSAPDGSIMDAGATQAVSVTSQTRSLNAQRSRQDKTLTTLKSTCMVALRDLFVKLIHSQGIADRMGTNLRASLIGCYESHWSRSIEYCLRKRLNVFEVDCQSFSKYLLYLFQVDCYVPSTIISQGLALGAKATLVLCTY